MGKINEIGQLTQTPYINVYALKCINKKGKAGNYYVASRAKNVEELKISSRKNQADGVVIYALYGAAQEQVVLIRQYRYSIDDYIYEFPAGLKEPHETDRETAVREMREETGLSLAPISVDALYERPFYTTIGMTDESCSMVYGYAAGEISYDRQEESEEIEVVLADRQEVRRILSDEQVSLTCAHMLMHFLYDTVPFDFIQH
ncbi:MAG: NUDIX hydrolase [Lachnospiraceae bacterium]